MDAASERPQAVRASSFRAGAELREARERLGWDLGEVAAALRIKLAYLQAIEDGRISALPGNAYALGFLRTYATTLGLDPDEVSRRFRAEAGDVNRRTELAFPAPVPERGVPTGAVILLGLVISAFAYIGWYRWSAHDQTPTHTVPPVPDQLLAAKKSAPVSPQVASMLPPPGTAAPSPVAGDNNAPAGASVTTDNTPPSVAVTPAPETQAGRGPVTEETVPGPSATSPSAMGPGAPGAGNVPAAQSSTPPASGVQAAPAASATQQPAATPASGIVLQATAVTWVQVRGDGGHVVWDHIMQPGDTWTVPTDQGALTLTTGNAGGLTISADGVSTGALGRAGSVRRNITLDAAAVKALASGVAPEAPAVTEPAHPRPRHVALPTPAAPQTSADELNARQLHRGNQAN